MQSAMLPHSSFSFPCPLPKELLAMVQQPLEVWVQGQGLQIHMVVGEDNQGYLIYPLFYVFSFLPLETLRGNSVVGPLHQQKT
jgi:hypothetical protein